MCTISSSQWLSCFFFPGFQAILQQLPPCFVANKMKPVGKAITKLIKNTFFSSFCKLDLPDVSILCSQVTVQHSKDAEIEKRETQNICKQIYQNPDPYVPALNRWAKWPPSCLQVAAGKRKVNWICGEMVSHTFRRRFNQPSADRPALGLASLWSHRLCVG